MAGITSRKELERQLEKARVAFRAAKMEYDTSSNALSTLQVQVQDASQRMAAARNAITDIGNHIQTMDLSGADAIRDRGDLRNYMLDGREYHIDKSDVNDIKMTPWKEYKMTLELNGPKAEQLDEEDYQDVAMVYASVLNDIKNK